MARYTDAYSKLLGRLHEVDCLRVLARQGGGLNINPLAIRRSRALYRGAVVLLSSHIEGFVEDLCILIVERIHGQGTPKAVFGGTFLYHFSKDIVARIKETNDPAGIATKIQILMSRDADIWDNSVAFQQAPSSQRFIDGFSTPKVENIRKMFARFGYASYLTDLRGHLAADGNACTNMVDKVVRERNNIAHGDVSITGTPSDVADMIMYVRLFCRGTDIVVANWCRSTGCVIR
jgi:hypothetical protein